MNASERGSAPLPDPPPRLHPGPALRTAADYAWRLLVIGAVAYFAVQLLSRLSLAVIPFLASILISALLCPLAQRLRRAGLSRWLATLLTMLISIVVLGGLLTIVIVRATQQAPQLGKEINNLLPHVKHWLIHGPLRLNPTTVNNLNNTISSDVTKNSSAVASTALSTGKTVIEFLSGLLLTIFSTIFLVYDGDRVWTFFLRGVPQGARSSVDSAGHAAWNTISYYIRGTLIVAFFHGVVVAVTLTVLDVPLAFPLGVLVALGSFVPLVGAVVTGVLAVAVAGVSHGLVAAIVMVAVLLLDNQVEAHVLQPFVVGRYVRIHPLAVVLSLAAGGILFGIVGAFIAVPVVATINSAVRAALGVRDQSAAATMAAQPVPSRGGQPPAPVEAAADGIDAAAETWDPTSGRE